MVDDPTAWEGHYAFASHIGMELTQWASGFAQVELPIVDHIKNRHGLPHGGVHASLLDTAMGYCGCYTGDPEAPQLCLTLNLNVNYIGVAKGARLIAEGRRTGGGKSTFFAEGEIKDDFGNLIGQGTGVFRYIKKQQV
ncbi:MAG: PaaI family thioesterase [Marinovum sp.]|nr:PaaI family thioesterase [Marinovum sp.]